MKKVILLFILFISQNLVFAQSSIDPYMETEFERIRTNQIKTIKVSTQEHLIRTEFYNQEDRLIRIEYPDIGSVEIFKTDDKYYYKVIDEELNIAENENNIFEINANFFIFRDWPYKQSIAEIVPIIIRNRIIIIYGNMYKDIYIHLYTYNSKNLIDKIYTYFYSEEKPEELPMLFSEEKYIYGSDNKLLYVEVKNLIYNDFKKITLEYNEREEPIKNEKEETLEYEYYEP